jgi:hypothetical protein
MLIKGSVGSLLVNKDFSNSIGMICEDSQLGSVAFLPDDNLEQAVGKANQIVGLPQRSMAHPPE